MIQSGRFMVGENIIQLQCYLELLIKLLIKQEKLVM